MVAISYGMITPKVDRAPLCTHDIAREGDMGNIVWLSSLVLICVARYISADMEDDLRMVLEDKVKLNQ